MTEEPYYIRDGRRFCVDCHGRGWHYIYDEYRSPTGAKFCHCNVGDQIRNEGYTLKFIGTGYHDSEGRPIGHYELKEPKGSGMCFISTTICFSLGKGDDCVELETLRDFRDKILLQDDNHKKLVSEYYDISPFLLEKLKILEKDNPDIYNQLYCNFIKPVLAHLDKMEYLLAIQKYKELVTYIKQTSVNRL